MKRTWFLLLLLLVACKKEETPVPMSAAAPAPAVQEARSGAAPAAPAETAPPLQPRMIIRNANVSLVVRDAADALAKVVVLVEARGGYVGEAKQWKENDQTRATAIVRVPSAQLSQSLAAIRALAIRVESENIAAQDVSQEFTDLSSQLKNLQATEVELRELLTTVRQRTQKASEILEIYNELTRIRGEIERTQGRIVYLSQMTAMSTITLDLVPDALAQPVVEPGWQPMGTLRDATRSLLNSLRGLADVAIWIVVYILPLAAIFIAFGLAIRAIWRRLKRADRSATQS